MKIHKKNSKRQCLRQKYKIEAKVVEHHRKVRKVAKKLGVYKRRSKDLGIPESYPHKKEVLEAKLLARREHKRVTEEARAGKKYKKIMEGRIYLGSKSSARQEILKSLGYHVICCPSDVSEELDVIPDTIEGRVMAVTKKKTDSVIALIKGRGDLEAKYLVCGDCLSFVDEDGKEALEKPKDLEQALEWHAKMHETRVFGTVQAVEVVDMITGKRIIGTDKAFVKFKPNPFPNVEDRKAYLEASGALAASGAVFIEHQYMASQIESVSGALDSIMGLSKSLVERLINDLKSTE